MEASAVSITYALAFNPKWYISDLTGRPAGGAALYSYRQLNKTEPKPLYQDPAGTLSWTNPILFDMNGTQGPIYGKIDTDDLSESYYLEAWSSDSDDAELLWTMDNFLPPAGGGGGGGSTTAINLTNLITNGAFYNHNSNVSPVTVSYNVAPSNHEQFSTPDIVFIKNNTAATDTLSFGNFSVGTLTGDTTPLQYLQYQCTNSPAGETEKCIQIPIQPKVNNLSTQEVTFSIWARCTSGTSTLGLYQYQFYGEGGSPSTSSPAFIQTLNLTSSWARYTVTFTFGNTSAKTLGDCGNDATYLRIRFPLGDPTLIQMALPSLYMGTLFPSNSFQLIDYVSSITNSPHTGDHIVSFRTTTPFGYVPMNDGSIGNASSNATTRANVDTFFLYKLIWDGVINTWAPTQDSSGTPVARGGSAIEDFVANKRLVLTRTLGRAISSAGAGSGLTARVLGQFLGEETVTLSEAQIPAHNHRFPSSVNYSGVTGGSGKLGFVQPGSLTTENTGGGQAHNNMPPTVFYNVFVKL